MKVAIIVNGISFHKTFLYHEILPALRALYEEVEVFETRSKHDAIHLASKAVDQKFDLIIAGGGDGTVHQVVNGILQHREDARDLPVLGIVPMGSGNDFARSLNLEQNLDQLLRLFRKAEPKKVDVGMMTYHEAGTTESAIRYFINEVDVGMGPEVVRKVNESGRPFGSAITYYLSILSTFISFKPMVVKIKTPKWSWEGKIRTLAVANGKYYGHGLCICPDSKPDDRIFGTFICEGVSALTFIRYSGDLKKGKHVRIPEIHYNEADFVELTSPQNCVIEADGEILGLLPAKIEMLPRQLSVLY